MLTIRKTKNYNCEIGKILRHHRLQLTDIPNERAKFIADRDSRLFNWEYTDDTGEGSWISEKTLMNYELGKNVPSLKYLKRLAYAYEMEPVELFIEILPYI